MERIDHPIPPLYDGISRILILGSFPSVKSREAMFFYGHPQNRFWPVLARVYGAEPPKTIAEKTALLLEHRLALWDVLQRCEIIGASDASIKNPIANDIPALIARSRITRVLCTGATSARLYTRLVLPQTNIPCEILPSPSAANARMRLEDLAREYELVILSK